VGNLRLNHERRLEAPPGFEPGMEVLQGHPRSFSRDRGFGLFRQKSETPNGLRGWLLPARCVRR
jgi:hypothetical protein